MSALVLGLGLAPHAVALDAGAKMPEIALADLGGKKIDLASLAGKVVIVDFWATWCAPCREELPELEKFHKKYGAKGLAIVGVSVDKEPGGIKDFLDKLKVTFPVVHDAGHQVSGKYSPPRMPSSYIIDRKGVVRYVHGGYRAGDAAEFDKQIQELLAK
jgi:cytochrome c biogenesis protein CcmG/thiol:disulfide interchange protein DsbE